MRLNIPPANTVSPSEYIRKLMLFWRKISAPAVMNKTFAEGRKMIDEFLNEEKQKEGAAALHPDPTTKEAIIDALETSYQNFQAFNETGNILIDTSDGAKKDNHKFVKELASAANVAEKEAMDTYYRTIAVILNSQVSGTHSGDSHNAELEGTRLRFVNLTVQAMRELKINLDVMSEFLVTEYNSPNNDLISAQFKDLSGFQTYVSKKVGFRKADASASSSSSASTNEDIDDDSENASAAAGSGNVISDINTDINKAERLKNSLEKAQSTNELLDLEDAETFIISYTQRNKLEHGNLREASISRILKIKKPAEKQTEFLEILKEIFEREHAIIESAVQEQKESEIRQKKLAEEAIATEALRIKQQQQANEEFANVQVALAAQLAEENQLAQEERQKLDVICNQAKDFLGNPEFSEQEKGFKNLSEKLSEFRKWNHPIGDVTIAECYINEIGVKRNFDEASKHLQLARKLSKEVSPDLQKKMAEIQQAIDTEFEKRNPRKEKDVQSQTQEEIAAARNMELLKKTKQAFLIGDEKKVLSLIESSEKLKDYAPYKEFLFQKISEFYQERNSNPKNIKESEKILQHAIKLGYKDKIVGQLLHNIALYNIYELKADKKTKNGAVKEGIKMLQQAVNMECPESIFDFAQLLYDGKLIAKDIEKATPLFLKAAKLECRKEDSLERIHNIALGKINSAKESQEAIRLFKEIAQMGHKPAINNLFKIGTHYFSGIVKGESQNIEKGIQLLLLAAKLGYKEDNIEGIIVQVISSYYKGQEVKKDIEQALNLAREAAKLKYKDPVKIIYNIALDYYNGTNGVKQDVAQAAELFLESAKLGYKESAAAIYKTSACYYQGEKGVKKDIEKALHLAQESAQLGHKDSAVIIHQVALCFSLGLGVKADLEQASKLFQQSAELGHKPAITAIHDLALNYYKGTSDFKKDVAQAASLFQKSANLGHEPSKNFLYDIARLYYLGQGGVEKNLKEAKKLCTNFLELKKGHELGTKLQKRIETELSFNAASAAAAVSATPPAEVLQPREARQVQQDINPKNVGRA